MNVQIKTGLVMDKRYILLVEDNPDDVALTQVAFRKCRIPCRLVVARDGQEALDYLFRQGRYADRDIDETPSIIILDLKLPYINGLEVLRQIRAEPETAEIPVAVLSSSIDEKEMRASYKLGANNYFRKPVDFDHFKEIIQRLCVSCLGVEET